MSDTIVALSSGALPSGVAVVRVSGPLAGNCVKVLTGSLPEARAAALRDLRSQDGSILDTGLVLWFPAPASFTGEDCAEFQVHGSRAVVDALLAELCGIDGVRLAEAGEFARRAFLNGKIDLTAAEGLSSLIEAETEAQRKLAFAQASGAQRALYEHWQDQLLNCRAMLEADIDFADEDDVPGSAADTVLPILDGLSQEISGHLAGAERGDRIRDGVRIALVGAPNAGKSSLLNALAGSDRAIVSDIPGTTRDVLEIRLDMGGYLVLLRDTAGLRDADDAIEKEGIRRARAAMEEADLVLLLSDSGDWPDTGMGRVANIYRVLTKCDLGRSRAVQADFAVSVRDARLFGSFTAWLTERVAELAEGDVLRLSAQRRHVAHLERCARHIDSAMDEDRPVELRAEALRSAAHALGAITGQVGVEDVLGRIFSSFCIGK